MPTIEVTHVKMKLPQLETNPPPPVKSTAPILEMIPRKKTQKSEAFINTCVSLIKQQWKKMIKVPQKCDFLIC